ncbi:MAG: methyltransferase [Gammaproteobacteria bacterium]|nr:methyltransferase [Gammaproteobacteria bacterium]MBT8109455.1 methyltransferase [Gammaproteobacteria bacterium]NND46407.1 class I SAM-dependent methyltransferase [Woeseiaceae bacterium]NNL44157.1 class I SAM-dependent methyltransferase [Woeseiaceae bacterium]
MLKYIVLLLAVTLAACQPAEESGTDSAADKTAAGESAMKNTRLATVLGAQPEEVQARYQYRHPKETLEFLGIEPGMTVVEGLPGRGWYTKVLLPYLGKDGHLIGANYAMDMWPNFAFANAEFLKTQSTWTTDWPVGAEEWRDQDSATIAAFNFGAMPDSMTGTADAVFLARVLHNLANFDDEGGFLSEAMADVFAVLKPGGVLGIVQHQARDDMSDEFADGSHGYLKKSFVIAAAEQAGFEFVAESDINENPADQPGEDDVVWRLPPTLGTSQDNPELKAEMQAIGESNRMTLMFRKPQ